MKVVLDTSVLIASFYQPLSGQGFSRQVYDFIIHNEKIYVSEWMMEEFKEKCRVKLKMSPAQIQKLQSFILERAYLIELGRKKFKEYAGLRDKNDAHILDLCARAGAEILLTWDKDLLVLKKMEGLKILTPREFWDCLSSME